MTQRKVNDLIARAEAHFARSEWDEAIACFREALQMEPKHAGASQGLKESQEKKKREEAILEHIAEARTRLEERSYDEAASILDQAHGLSANSHILQPIAEIDRLRGQVQERKQWQIRTQAEVTTARRQAQGGDGDGALQTLDAALSGLAAAGLAEMGEEARQERDRLLQGMEVEDKIARAQAAYDRHDYQMACKLAEELRAQAPQRRQVSKLRDNACERWERISALEKEVRQALAEGRLEDAVAILRQLKDDETMKNNPNWQGLWLQGYSQRGVECVEKGRQALQRRAFEAAISAFADAQKAFAAVLEVFPAHQMAEPARNEVEALYALAVAANQAQMDLDAGRWESARTNLQAAQQQREIARVVRKHDFRDVEAVLTALLGEAHKRIENLNSARAKLKEGEDKLKDRQPDKAEALLREGLEKVADQDAGLQEALLAALRRTTRVQSTVENWVEQADRIEDAQEKAARLADAYSQWPGMKDLADKYATALLAVGTQAQDAGHEAKAADCFAHLLSLEGVSPQIVGEAQNRQKDLGAEQKARAALKQAQSQRTEAEDAPAPLEEEYQRVLDLLADGASYVANITQAGKRNVLQKIYTQEQQKADAALKQVQTARQLWRQAEDAHRIGDWEQAVNHLQQAIGALGQIPAREWRQKLKQWRDLADALRKAQQEGETALTKAETLYQAAGGGKLEAVAWQDLDAALTAAETALRQELPEGEPRPDWWAGVSERVADLRKRQTMLQGVRDSVRNDRTQEALINLRMGKAQWPADGSLAAVYNTLHTVHSQRMQEEAGRVFAEAQSALASGEMEEALEKLRQVQEWAPTTDVSAQARRLQRQSEIWQEVTRLDIEGTAKRQGGSLDEALVAFEQALQKAASPEAALPAEVRKALNALLGQKGELHKEEVYTESKKWLNKIRDLAVDHPIVQRHLLSLVLSWHDLASRTAREIYIRSRLALDKLEDAYEEVVKYASAHPSDPRALQLAAETKGKLLSSVHGSAQKRLGYAQEMMGKGNYEGAQKALDDIEREWLGRLEARFPGVFADDVEIEAVRQEAGDLGSELRHLTEIAKALKEFPAQIREAYIAGDLEKAERLIAHAESLDAKKEAVLLWQDIADLKDKVQKAGQKRVREEAEQTLSAADSVLTVAKGAEPLRDSLTSLSSLQARVEKYLAGPEGEEVRKLLPERIAAVQRRLGEIEGMQTARKTAQQALEKDTLEDLEVAIQSLDRALPNAHGAELEELHIQRDRLLQRKKVKEHEGLKDKTWQDALIEFEDGRWAEAKEKMTAARLLGKPADDVRPYLDAIAAARTLDRALAQEKEGRPEEAQRLLQNAAIQIAQCPPAQDLLKQIEEHLKRIAGVVESRRQEAKTKQTWATQNKKLLAEAQSAYRRERLQEARAKLNELLERDAENEEIETLRQQLDNAEKAQGLLAQAEEQRRAGEYDAASALLNEAYVCYPHLSTAAALKQQLASEREAGQHLLKARSLAGSQQFAEAWQAMAKAQELHAAHPLWDQIKQEINEWEGRFRRQKLQPISESLRSKDYQKAATQADQLALQAGSDDFKTEVHQQRQKISDEWAKDLLERMDRALAEPPSPESLPRLQALREEAAVLLTAAIPPAGNQPQRLQANNIEIEKRRLRQRLSEGAGEMKEGRLEAAAAIAQEVKEEAGRLGLTQIKYEAGDLELKVAGKQDEETRGKHEKHLEEAREAFGKAGKLFDLERAGEFIQKALAVEGYATSSAARHLQVQIDDQLAKGQNSKRLMGEADQFLRKQNYRKAIEVLEEAAPLTFQEQERDNLLELARSLQQAEDREMDDPEFALDARQSAVERKPDLKASLEPAMQRCRRVLLERMLGDIDADLQMPVPNAEALARKLQQVQDSGWVTPERRRDMEDARRRVQGLGLRNKAVTALAERDAPDEALDLLRQLRAQTPDGRLEPIDAGWEAAARSLQALAGAQTSLDPVRLAEAQRWYDEIPAVLTSYGFVKDLRARIERTRALVDQVQAAEKRVRTARSSTPPDYKDAIAASLSALSLSSPPHARAQDLIRSVKDALLGEIERRRITGSERYGEIPEFVQHLATLLPGDPEPVQLQASIEKERQDRLQKALAAAAGAIDRYELDEAGQVLSRARLLASVDEKTTVTALQVKLEQRQQRQQDIDDAIAQARSTRNLHDAIKMTAEKLDDASDYPPLQQWAQALSDLVARAIPDRLTEHEFAEALALSREAASLGDRERFTSLEQSVARAQKAYEESEKAQAEIAYQRAKAALARFSLDTAAAALTAAKQRLSDPRFDDLSEEIHTAQEIAPKLRQTMEQGWGHFENRRFEAARDSFADAKRLAQGFMSEPDSWHAYAGNMMYGINQTTPRVDQSGEDRLATLSSAVDSFTSAETSLRTSDPEALPVLWGDQLRRERRRAVYYAFRLRQQTEGFIADRVKVKEKTKLQSSRSMREGQELLYEVKQRESQFESFISLPADPPADFDDSWSAAGSLAAPSARSSRPSAPPPATSLPPIASPPPAPLPPPTTEPFPPQPEPGLLAFRSPAHPTPAPSSDPPDPPDTTLPEIDYNALFGGLDVSLPPEEGK